MRKRAPKFKFEPVDIPRIPPLLPNASDEERRQWQSELLARDKAVAKAAFERMLVIAQHYSVDVSSDLLALHLAMDFVEGFNPAIPPKKKGGNQRIGRFHLVTEVEQFAAENAVGIAEATRQLAEHSTFRTLSGESLETLYYRYKRELEKNEACSAVLNLWRKEPVQVRRHYKQDIDRVFEVYERRMLVGDPR